MSNLTLRYEALHFYAERKQIDSAKFRAMLDGNLIDYQLLDYDAEAVSGCLEALNTWVFANNNTPNFTKMPILIYNEVLWESPDKAEKFAKTYCAMSVDDLPTDFVEKAVKL